MGDDIASISSAIRDIPDFPKPGIVFKDITPLFSDGRLFAKTIDLIAARYEGKRSTRCWASSPVGLSSVRHLAYKLGAGFSVVRKPGKLPYDTHSASYELGVWQGHAGNPC